MIRRVKGGWRVVARSGRNMGTYRNKEDAEARLGQIEAFKEAGARGRAAHSPRVTRREGGYSVLAKSGRSMGNYRTKEEALRRKGQLEATAAKFFERVRGYTKKSAGSPSGYRARWVTEIRELLEQGGYAGDLQKHAERLVREGYGPEEIAHRIRNGNISNAFGIQIAKKGYFNHSWPGQPRRHAKAAKLGKKRHARRYSHSPSGWVWVSTENGHIYALEETDQRSGGVTLRRIGFGKPEYVYVPKARFERVFVKRKAQPHDRMFLKSPTSEVKGKRIQLHPATDQWMMGDRFGTITRANKDGSFQVKMDRSGRSYKVKPEHIGEWV